jgi:hypothetical protein
VQVLEFLPTQHIIIFGKKTGDKTD